MIKPYNIDSTTEKYLTDWFDDDSAPRKKALVGREFHIDEV